MNRNLSAPLVAMVLAFTIVIFTTVIGRSQREQTNQLSSTFIATNSQISRLSERVTSMTATNAPTLDAALLWTEDTNQSPDQALQAWALGALQRHQQDIRQYVQTPPLTSVAHPTVGLRLEFSGSLEGLIAFLMEAEQMRPAAVIDSLQVRTLAQREQRDGQTHVATQLILWGLSDEGI